MSNQEQVQEIETIAAPMRDEIVKVCSLLKPLCLGNNKDYLWLKRRMLALLCDEFAAKKHGIEVRDYLRRMDPKGKHVQACLTHMPQIIYGHYGRTSVAQVQRIEAMCNGGK